ncbi:dihydroxyacetone kinase subunit L [Treponema sp. OMZ 840]|uniref:dihydroxyacetone kinase subunit DhaL n=1 Tax=Treponema sp. OMZ 840 TaxID=244313 RepID=UPI003D8B5326
MNGFKNIDGKVIVEDLINTIQKNTAYLSEVDGAIGDGDHGINMNKGFSLCAKAIEGKDLSFSDAAMILGKTLLLEIGGSMGPLYGCFFKEIAKKGKDKEIIDAVSFCDMIESGIAGIQSVGKARVGDKTLLDTLVPASVALRNSVNEGETFENALIQMTAAAEKGMSSTKDMIAKVGRASRLGERSRGTLDAGAVSSYLLIDSMARSIHNLLKKT